MADPSDSPFGIGAMIAGGVALLGAAGAAIKNAVPKIQKALEARHKARLELAREQRSLLRERVAFAQAHGDLDQWGAEHPVCQLLDHCRDALGVVDEGHYVWGNPAFCDILGFEPGEISGVPWAERIAPESIEAVSAARELLMNGESIAEFKIRLRRKQGELITVAAYSTPGPKAQLVLLRLVLK